MSAAWTERLREAEALVSLRGALEAGEARDLSGLHGSARLLVALLASDRPLVVVVPSERDVDRVASDLRFFCGELGERRAVRPFPSPGPAPFRGLPRHAEASLQRAAALHGARRGRLRAVVASPIGLMRPVLAPEFFSVRELELRRDEEMMPELLLEALDDAGYRANDPVEEPGEMARRGGILDFFPPERGWPVRLEFLGDTIETLRSFDPGSQRSLESLDRVELSPLSDIFATRRLLERLGPRLEERFGDSGAHEWLVERIERGLVPEEVVELLPLVTGALVPAWEYFTDSVRVVLDPEAVEAAARDFQDRVETDRSDRPQPLSLEPEEVLIAPDALLDHLAQAPAIRLREIDPERPEIPLGSRPVRHYLGDFRQLGSDLAASPHHTVIVLETAGRVERLTDLLGEDGLSLGETGRVELRHGELSAGFELPTLGLQLLADADVFPAEVRLRQRRSRARAHRFGSDFRDLEIGDLVVHTDHGIGRFEGLETLDVGGARVEFMVVSYKGGDKLKVPIDSFDRVQRYARTEGARPNMDRLGSGSWQKVKRGVKKAMRDMAQELLRLYAERKARPGHSFTSQSPWLSEFEHAFEFDETPDQARAIVDVAGDMGDASPMDRLVCGDVGYGKTEVAMRAAMRAVLDGKQVALLAPTTILAFQHWKTFQKRFAAFPVIIEMLSRMRSPREVKRIVKDVASGKVDILIGTHRILSKDMAFRDLGVLVVDEEQRFGVVAKERLKKLRRGVDCLTLSATPIPRTLQMGLAGIRDMSVIETPPKDRLAIQTAIVKFSTDTIAAAIRQELQRDGQVFFVHNRVESIESLANMVTRLVPEARVAVAHGQMPETLLEQRMLDFVEGRADVLVATTIVENGLDIPRANTILINRADRYGLAQLYQLRGRVGRADRRAYAHLLVPPDTVLSEIAQKRLAAIRDFSELGAGFRIAALDLEQRGAGNLLGGEQSGHIRAIGLDLYIKLLEQTILELKGDAAPSDSPVSLNLRLDLRIPESDVPDVHQRMVLYKRLSQVRHHEELVALREEIRDRYGAPSAAIERLIRFADQRVRCRLLGVGQVDRGASVLRLHFAEQTPVAPEVIVELVGATRGAALQPDGLLAIPCAQDADPLECLEGLLTRLETAQKVPVA